MNEQKMNELMNFLLVTLKDTKEFTQEQAPAVAREMLAWGAYEAKLGMFLASCFILAGITFVFGGSILRNSKYKYDWDFFAFMMICFGSIGILGGFIGLPCEYSNLKKIELAPKVYLMEKTLEMTKK